MKMGFSVLHHLFHSFLHFPVTWCLMPPSDNTMPQTLCQNYFLCLPSPQSNNGHFLSEQIPVARHKGVMSWSNPQPQVDLTMKLQLLSWRSSPMQRPVTCAGGYMETHLMELTPKTKVTSGEIGGDQKWKWWAKPVHKVLNCYKETVSCITCIIKINTKQKCLSLVNVSLTLSYLSSLSQITPRHKLVHSQLPEHALFLLPYLFSLSPTQNAFLLLLYQAKHSPSQDRNLSVI